MGNHDVTRIATLVGPRLAPVAAAILMSLPGAPSVYYGDEQGFTGTKREQFAGDDEVRPALPDSPADLSPLGEPIHRDYQNLIGFRRRHPWLSTAAVEVTSKSNETLTYRCTSGDDWCDVSIDLRGPSITLSADDETIRIG